MVKMRGPRVRGAEVSGREPPDGERQMVRVSLDVYLEDYESEGVKGEEAQRGKWGEEEGEEEPGSSNPEL